MLWFVGLGISGADSVSALAKKVIKESDIIYVEEFTSPTGDLDGFGLPNNTRTAKRWMVEDGKELLKNAKEKNVVLASYGDPYVATTHVELRVRAIQDGIKTQTVHASSAFAAIPGECGLHHYKMGRVATVMDDAGSAATPYWITYRNMVQGNHTMLLLEYNQDKKFFLDPRDALKLMMTAEAGQTRGVFSESMFVIVASRIGMNTQSIVAGNISSMLHHDFGKPPHTVILPGRMHFTESDALHALATCLDMPSDNSDRLQSIPRQMITRYVPMIRDALKEVTPYADSKFQSVLENAELYARDAEHFLEQGQDEVAILSIGYADGLVDALRIAAGLDPGTRPAQR